jgi:hypothetical protein
VSEGAKRPRIREERSDERSENQPERSENQCLVEQSEKSLPESAEGRTRLHSSESEMAPQARTSEASVSRGRRRTAE